MYNKAVFFVNPRSFSPFLYFRIYVPQLVALRFQGFLFPTWFSNDSLRYFEASAKFLNIVCLGDSGLMKPKPLNVLLMPKRSKVLIAPSLQLFYAFFSFFYYHPFSFHTYKYTMENIFCQQIVAVETNIKV
ncbi:MAG TPA: hypothetical protein VK469_12070, partial [Candidatus Kapabacteria bacterium]|nr:hypothetical protein [Candidatus Kapabacteria bacterium]